MSIPYAINGLGRVGRALLRVARGAPGLELVAVNDLATPEQLARLVARDSVHGVFAGTVEAAEGALVLDGRPVPVYREADPAAIPWGDAGPRIVVEATGASRNRAFASGHLGPSVERVLAAWNPADPKDVDVTLCAGINDGAFDPRLHRLISAASCTTNCLAPLALVLHRAFGLRRAMTNSVHGVTNNQVLLDGAHPEPRRGRSALLNIVPTASNAAPALGTVLPELAGRLESFAVRVPAPHGALLDVVAELETSEPIAAKVVCRLFREAAAGPLGRLLAVAQDEPVSSDVVGDPHSAVVDLPLIQVIDGGLVRVVAWYDNEWGYAHRLTELLQLLGAS